MVQQRISLDLSSCQRCRGCGPGWQMVPIDLLQDSSARDLRAETVSRLLKTASLSARRIGFIGGHAATFNDGTGSFGAIAEVRGT